MTSPLCGTPAASCNSQPLEIGIELSEPANAATAQSSAEKVANSSPVWRVLIKIIRANDDAPQGRWQEMVLQKSLFFPFGTRSVHRDGTTKLVSYQAVTVEFE
jgi:hypothetical protein